LSRKGEIPPPAHMHIANVMATLKTLAHFGDSTNDIMRICLGAALCAASRYLQKFRILLKQHPRFALLPKNKDALKEIIGESDQIPTKMRDQFRVGKIKSDGHCLFRSYSFALFGTQDYFLHLRLICCLEMWENAFYFESNKSQFFELENIYQVIANTARYMDSPSWGSAIHSMCMSLATKREVYVYFNQCYFEPDHGQHSESTNRHIRYMPLEAEATLDPIMVLHSGSGPSSHYSVIVPINQTASAVIPSVNGSTSPSAAIKAANLCQTKK
jgi:hypothetical protein